MFAHMTHSLAHNAGHGSATIVIAVAALAAAFGFAAWYVRRK